MVSRRSLIAACCLALVSAYQPSKVVRKQAAAAAATAALSVLLAGEPAFADSDAAAQINLNALPPNSISIQIGDLPVVGNLISGTYTRVPDGSVKNPSVVITSPSDKLKAISKIAKEGHLEFDINGKIKTHLDVDGACDVLSFDIFQ